MKPENHVVEDMNYCIDALAVSLGIPLVGERPGISITDSATIYDSRRNAIHLAESDIGNGDIYFEEACRFLRRDAVPEPMDDLDIRIDEFFGRIASEIGRNVADNKHSRLFHGLQPRHFSDMETFEKHASGYMDIFADSYRNLVEKTARISNSSEIMGIHIYFVTTMMDALRKYDAERDIDKLVETTGKVFRELPEKEKKLEGLKTFGELNEKHEKFHKIIESLIVDIRGIKGIRDKDRDSGDYFINESRAEAEQSYIATAFENIRKISEIIEECRTALVSTERHYKTLGLGLNPANWNFSEHFIGYVAAELYMKENPEFRDWLPELFRMRSSEIAEKFFKNKALEPYLDKLNTLIDEKITPVIKGDKNGAGPRDY